jgi:phosphoglycolate phosphatase
MYRMGFAAVDGARADVPLKPDAAAALMQAERMGRRADDVVFVGDSVVDFETAINAGMRSVLVTWGFTPGDVLRGCAGGDVCVSVDEVLSAVWS